MNSFKLKIVTPDGLAYEGTAEEVIVRTTSGDMGICAGHIPCVAPLGMGRATIVTNGQKRYAACIGGMISVTKEGVRIVATTFEWAENIDLPRAQRALERAQSVLESKDAAATDIALAEAKLRRALIRKGVADLR